ncbi:HAD family hydrolase [Thermogymnomonas acidicola]|nr:HAD-IA family hydrolase [Thermogymnomonas acidicola]
MGGRLIRAVLFDMDGTLLESEWLSAISNDIAFETVFGRHITRGEVKELTGRPVSEILREKYGEKGDEVYALSRAFFRRNSRAVSLYPGVLEALKHISRKARLAVVTASKREDAVRLLCINCILDYFSTIVAQEDTRYHKPDPEPVLLALSRLSVTPGEAVMVGDQPWDIIAAREAGVVSVAALWGAGIEDELYMYRPDYTARDPAELVEIFERLMQA